jgi:hypothetical protein
MTSRARHTDPSSSRAAADVVSRGIAGHQQRQAAAAVRACPGRTSCELSIETGLDRYMLARRLPELLEAGAVIRKEPRPDRHTGRPGVTWWPQKQETAA